MDWKKLNFDEIGYYCKSTKTNVDFECWPLRYQIEMLLGILHYYEIYQFKIKDIQTIYAVLHVRKMRSDGILMPQPKKLQMILEKLADEGKVIIKTDVYIITDRNGEDRGYYIDYAEEIERGYCEGYISGWIAYDKKNSILKTEHLPL